MKRIGGHAGPSTRTADATTRTADKRTDRSTWRPPTRRAFVAMLGAAAAALALRDKVPTPTDPPRSTWNGKTRWIGHC